MKASRVPYATMALVCILAVANIWLGPGIIQTHAGGDSPFLLQRVYELAVNLRVGVFPARWMPDAAFGLGYPFFNFYAALPYYLAAALNLTGFDIISAIKLVQTVGMFAAALTMWIYAQTILPKPGAVLAAVAYTLAPYHLVNVYVRGDSLQEFYAFIWYPLILWGIDRVLEVDESAHPSVRSNTAHAHRLWMVVLLALAVAGLVLTHNVSALLFAPVIVIYTLFRFRQYLRDRSDSTVPGVVGLVSAAVLAVGLTAWFWLPALGEAGAVQLGNQTTGYFDYNNHFRGLNLVQGTLIYDYTVESHLNVFAMALPQVVMLAIGAGTWLLARTKRSALLVIGLLFGLVTLMITPLSKPLWQNLPLLALAQFPWRFLSIQALFGALLIGGVAYPLKGVPSAVRRSVVVVTDCGPNETKLGMISILLAVAASLLSLPGLPNVHLDVRAEDVTPENLQLYEWFSGNIGTTIRAEYLPATVQPRPMVGPDLLQMSPRAFVIAGNVNASSLVRKTVVAQVWRITVDTSIATMTLPLLYWPAWRANMAAVDSSGAITESKPLSIAAYAGSGWVMLSLPRGTYQVSLTLAGTPLEHTGDAISAIFLLILVIVVALTIRMGSYPAKTAIWGMLVLGLAICTTVVVAQVVRFLYAPMSPALQTMDYTDRQFVHRSPITYRSLDGDSFVLVGASVSPTHVQAGQVFTLTTAWRDNQMPAQVGPEQQLPPGGYAAYLFRYARKVSYGSPEVSMHVALPNAMPGPMPLRLLARDAAGHILTPTTPEGRVLDDIFLAGFVIEPTTSPEESPNFTDSVRTFPNGIVLRHIDWYQPTAHDLCFRPIWSSTRPLAAALQVSYLLKGSDSRVIASADTQPQSGLAPTWAWQVGKPVLDSQCIRIQESLRAGEPYTLEVRWYQVYDQKSVGEVTLVGTREEKDNNIVNYPHPVITSHSYTPGVMQHTSNAVFNSSIQLLGYDTSVQNDSLHVTLYWSATATVTNDYKSFIHLTTLDAPEPVRQVDHLTRDGAYPTGMWLPGEIVSDTVSLSLSGLPSGTYHLSLGWYDPDTLQRLPAESSSGPFVDGIYFLPDITH